MLRGGTNKYTAAEYLESPNTRELPFKETIESQDKDEVSSDVQHSGKDAGSYEGGNEDVQQLDKDFGKDTSKVSSNLSPVRN